MTPQQKESIIATILVFTLMYLAISFMAWNIDCREWLTSTRVLYVIISAFISVAISIKS